MINYPPVNFSRYRVGNVIVIYDLCETAGGMSVTNGAERVIELLSLPQTYPDFSECRVVYRDTEGRFDELRHDGRQFTGFGMLGVYSDEEAIKAIEGEMA